MAVALANTMTLLFTDLVGSTAMGDRLGDDRAEAVRRRFFQIIEEAVEPTGGRIVKTMGDGHMVAFISALDAIGCAIAIQAGVETYNSEHGAEQLGVRIGINAGDVSVEGEDYFGTPVTIAKRLCDSAVGGQILVSGLVESLVGSRGGFAFRTVGSLDLRGLSRPQAASEVVWRGDGVAAGPLPAAAQMPEGERRNRILLGAGAAALVAIVVIAVVALAGDGDDEPSSGAKDTATVSTGSPAGSPTVRQRPSRLRPDPHSSTSRVSCRRSTRAGTSASRGRRATSSASMPRGGSARSTSSSSSARRMGR